MLTLASCLVAMPARPGLFDPTTGHSVASGAPAPVFPSDFGQPGPNKLKGSDHCETAAVLVQFPDNLADAARHRPANFDSMFYSTGVYRGGPHRQGSLKDFFLENSYGDYEVRGGVAGDWTTSSHNYAEYRDGNYMLGTAGHLVADVMPEVDQVVDFRSFDSDHDGHIDGIFLVHAGAGAEDDGNVDHCWSRAFPALNYHTDDGVTIDGLTLVPEVALVGTARETTLCCVAVMCHELGHVLGLPDLYDYSRFTWGIGYWGLMGYGAWGAGGNTPWSPSHLDAWCKVEAGFVTPVVITRDMPNLHILDAETHPVAYKVWRAGADGDTCFYLENRQKKGFDSLLPGPGLLIWHIDPAYGDMHNVVDLEEDSTFHLDQGEGVRPDPHIYHPELGDTSDPLPGNGQRTAFDESTTPSSSDREGQPTAISIRNIRLEGDTVVCDVALGAGSTEEPAPPLPVSRLTARPNPFSEEIELRLDRPCGDSRLDGVVSIYACTGTLVWQGSFDGSGCLVWRGTDRAGRRLPVGVYLAQLSTRRRVYTHKLVLQR